MPTCKECRFFIQGEGKSGTCEKKPYISTKQGMVQMINGKPRKLILYWSKPACKMFDALAELKKKYTGVEDGDGRN